MEQLLVVLAGTFITVCYYITTPVKLSQVILSFIERLGRNYAAMPGAKPRMARSYYVRNSK